MTDISALIAQIRELLPKVYEGQWSVEEFQQGGATWGNIISSHGTIIAEVRGALGRCGNGDNANWLALLNPVTVTALLDRIEELEKDLKYESDRGDEWLEHATYDVGGSPHLWKDRATTAESKLAEARADALEEAEKAVREILNPDVSSFVMTGPAGIIRQAVDAIRAMAARAALDQDKGSESDGI